MRQVVLFAFMALSYLALGFEVKEVKVGGQDKAQIQFLGGVPSQPPSWKVNENSIEFSWPQTSLAKTHGEKLELLAPHSLVKRLTLIKGADESLKVKVIMNGSMEGIRERIRWEALNGNPILSIDYPEKNANALKLLQEEQTPLAASAGGRIEHSTGSNRTLFVLMSFVFVLLSVGVLVLFRFLKQKGTLRGPRKYLIEQLGYCALGAKTGVSLLKVGNEFVLVGVTPNQISMLSQLPKLQEQYAEESGFERSVFKEAVSQEVQRLR